MKKFLIILKHDNFVVSTDLRSEAAAYVVFKRIYGTEFIDAIEL